MFPVARSRPENLSNRQCCYSDQELAAILRKPDDDLLWSDFAAIFPVSACAGEYDEQLYFVPLAFEHLARHPMNGREYVSGFIEFFVRNSAALERDQLSGAAREAAGTLISRWTSTFTVVHFDEAACRAKGWTIDYLDVVSNSTAVVEFLELLMRGPFFDQSAEQALRKLIDSTSSEAHAAWFLEIARALQDNEVDFLEHLSPECRRSSAVDVPARRALDVLTSQEVLRGQYERLRSSVIACEPSPTYWRDVLIALGLAA